jgi:hypothetical protein
MKTLRTTFAITVAALLAAVTLTALAPSAGAAPASERAGRTYYGALAIATDGAVGGYYNARSKAAAFGGALRQCRQKSNYPGTCVKVGWVRNACGAVSVKFGSDGFVSDVRFGWGPSKRVAIAQARRGFGGQIRGWVCTAR